ncbi:hypothetical protein MBRA_32760 [Mycobacterium branderi]|uniref:Uncharacterized protein n=1 Tax=Mycobacterium branderi TaxID=43348 RepID=A0ABN6B967_9MYCO|nr:hypothetical protein MBRA_32760 [Mycobacterium branderi]
MPPRRKLREVPGGPADHLGPAATTLESPAAYARKILRRLLSAGTPPSASRQEVGTELRRVGCPLRPPNKLNSDDRTAVLLVGMPRGYPLDIGINMCFWPENIALRSR